MISQHCLCPYMLTNHRIIKKRPSSSPSSTLNFSFSAALMDSFQKLQLQLLCKHCLGWRRLPPNCSFTSLHPLQETLRCFLPPGGIFCGIESPSKPVLSCLKMDSEGMIFRRGKLSFVIPENLSHCYPLPVTTLGAQSGNCVPVGRGSGKYLGIVQEEKFSTNTSCCCSSGGECSACCPGFWESLDSLGWSGFAANAINS